MSIHDVALALALGLVLAGAFGTTFTRDVTRLVLSLGTFLAGVALAFLVLGSPLLAAAQVFVYVGGVLVLVLFALMVVRRAGGQPPRVESRHETSAALVAFGVFALLAVVVAPATGGGGEGSVVAPQAVGELLLGRNLVAFELAGVVLLAALLAVLVIVKGGGER